jgi:hypothetical protein
MDETNDDPALIAFRDKFLAGQRAAARRAAEGADWPCEICGGGSAPKFDVLMVSGDIKHVCAICLRDLMFAPIGLAAPPPASAMPVAFIGGAPDDYSIEDDDGVRSVGIPDDLF